MKINTSPWSSRARFQQLLCDFGLTKVLEKTVVCYTSLGFTWTESSWVVRGLLPSVMMSLQDSVKSPSLLSHRPTSHPTDKIPSFLRFRLKTFSELLLMLSFIP
jgi:hypothetical protein